MTIYTKGTFKIVENPAIVEKFLLTEQSAIVRFYCTSLCSALLDNTVLTALSGRSNKIYYHLKLPCTVLDPPKVLLLRVSCGKTLAKVEIISESFHKSEIFFPLKV